MAKIVRLEPIAQETSIETNGNLLSVLLNKDLDVLKECGGRGMCATCHIYVQDGMDALTPHQPPRAAHPGSHYLLQAQLPARLPVAGHWQRRGRRAAPWYVRQLSPGY